MCVFFQVEAPIPVGASAWGIATADLNADGIPDVVVALPSANEVAVAFGAGSGGFAGTKFYAAGTDPTTVALGDINGDGKSDIVVADGTGGSVDVLLNTGAGKFAAPKSYAIGTSTDPTAMVLADLNGDGKQDVAVADTGTNKVSVLLNTGSGFAAAVSYAVGSAPDAIATDVLNSSGLPSLSVADGGSNQISVLPEVGGGKFGPAVTYTVGTHPTAIATAALQGSGLKDVIVAAGDGSVTVLANNGSGMLTLWQTLHVAGSATSVVAADINGDGLADLIVGASGSNQISVFLNNDFGSFNATPLVYQLPQAPVALAVADVNKDGRPDILATFANGSVEVIQNTSDYTAAQAIAAYAANPNLSLLPVSDTGADIGAHLDGLQALSAAGVLGQVTDADFGSISLTATQLFADTGALTAVANNAAPQLYVSGPLSGQLTDWFDGIGLYGTLTNTGSVTASTAGGNLVMYGNYNFDGVTPDVFQNNGTVAVGNGYDLWLGVNVANAGLFSVSGGAMLALGGTPNGGYWNGLVTTVGSIAINDATVKLYGNLQQPAALSGVTNVGGLLELAGTFYNQGTLAVGGGSGLGTVRLLGTIGASTISDAGGGLQFIDDKLGLGSATLQSDTYEGVLALNLVDDVVTIRNDIKLSGVGGIGAAAVELTGVKATLDVQGDTTLANATIYIGSHSADGPAVLYAEEGSSAGGNPIAGTGMLILAPSLTITQTGLHAALIADRASGDGFTNHGVIKAIAAHGQFSVEGGTFSNLGSIVVANTDTFWLDSDSLANLAGGTLTGGSWEVDAGSVLWLPDNANVVSDAATLTLAGNATATPLVEWNSWSTAAPETLQQTLGTIAAGGVLNLQGAWSFADTATGGLAIAGTVTDAGATLTAAKITLMSGGKLSGNGTVGGAIADGGSITATGGLLDLTGAVTGSATLAIATGATLEIGDATTSAEVVQFAPTAPGVLVIDTPASDHASVAGFALGDTIDLKGLTETSFSFSGGVLTVNGAGGATATLTFIGSYTAANFTMTNSGGMTVVTDPPAARVHAALAASAASPDLIALGGAMPAPAGVPLPDGPASGSSATLGSAALDDPNAATAVVSTPTLHPG